MGFFGSGAQQRRGTALIRLLLAYAHLWVQEMDRTSSGGDTGRQFGLYLIADMNKARRVAIKKHRRKQKQLKARSKEELSRA